MNERIRELAEQAKNDLVTEIHSKATGMDINIVKIIVLGSKLKDDYAQDFSTKFAELLVRQCIKSTLSLRDTAIDNEWNLDETFHMIVDTIVEDLDMQHIFRVEE